MLINLGAAKRKPVVGFFAGVYKPMFDSALNIASHFYEATGKFVDHRRVEWTDAL